ncbi:acyltransferase [Mesorhizobium sp. NZP2077]|uniref:acyltransferase family protein n=1 Tax=Mesorhizobium sp. NZP2077 TaxID=2483404 RepID=UPI001FEF39F3|nr:acyltransferase [Mesorhizobium sp. NZP2077]
MGSDQDENRRYEAIDALRAIAVMLVLIFHYTSRFPPDYIRFDHQMELPWQGVVGVFLFFIISGYCIAMTAERAGTVWMFWLQRFTRLEPALIACIAITLVVVAALGLPGREVSALDGLKNASWVTLFVPTPLVDGAYWSLLEEAKFYFVFGLIFYLWPNRVLAVFTGFTVLGAIAQFSGLWRDHQALIYPFKGIATPYFFFPYSLFFLMGIAARRSTRAVQMVVMAGCLVHQAVGRLSIQCLGHRAFNSWCHRGPAARYQDLAKRQLYRLDQLSAVSSASECRCRVHTMAGYVDRFPVSPDRHSVLHRGRHGCVHRMVGRA